MAQKSALPGRAGLRTRTRDPLTTSLSGSSCVSPMHSRVFRLLDVETKLEAEKVLSNGISSISRDCIRDCVFSKHERARFHTWGLCAKGTDRVLVLSATVFRRHQKIGLIELSLIATDRNSRGSGHGTKLLHHMLRMWRSEGFEYVLTFADVNAVPFFESVGFRSDIPVPRDLYDCWIDKYSHSILMCFSLHKPGSIENITSELESVEILVFMDNVDRRPAERWVKGVVTDTDDTNVRVVYSYNLRTYSEWLPEESIRIRLPV